VRVAAFDCGTNSLRLLVADIDPATGRLDELAREMRIVRLGEGVDRTGRISEASLDRTFAALEEYDALLADLRPEKVRFCATSAARDAENSDEFVAAVLDRVGVAPEVLTGDEEAQASFEGATRSFPDLRSPCLVLDIGGGSTELVLGAPRQARGPDEAQSLDLGSVRLTERHLHDDPPTAAQVAAVRSDVDVALDECRVDASSAATVIGVAGTVTTVAAGVLDLASYQRDRIHHADLPVPAVLETIDALVGMTVAERRALGYMHPGRADVLAAGALILERVLSRTRVRSLRVSESDILDGIAWSMVSDH
jgi:exopolyphosphatase/guanosine-5'-triphosphate,3'-diphosphate pyrophosphatase